MSVFNRLMMKGSGTASPSLSEDKTLSLSHLKKLYAELRHLSPTAAGSLEDRLYTMVPLFIKVFKDHNPLDIANKFPEVNQFCAQVSHLLVDQIRRRAMNQSTERASSAIVQFLEDEPSGLASKGGGWPLLGVLDILSLGGNVLIDCMISASLPSTMVKCLYLFFDLPTPSAAGASAAGGNKNLQKLFVQILTHVCSTSAGPAEELARKDDLQLLFNAISSPCPAHNIGWRKGASEVLMAISRRGLSMTVIQYIQSKDCILNTMSNMGDHEAITPMETVEMLVTIFCFLKDSSEVSQKLLEDFKIGGGYKFLFGFLLRLELDTSVDVKQTLRNLVLLIGSLCTCGYEEIKMTHDLSRYKGMDIDFSAPRCKGVTVRNLDAYQVLQDVFVKAKSDHLCGTLLDVMSSIYCQDTTNYFLLEPHHSLSIFASVISDKPEEIQKKYFLMFETISSTLMFIPYKELSSLSLLLKTNKSAGTSVLCTKTLHRVITRFPKFKDVFREVGLVDVLVTCLIRFATVLKDTQGEDGISEVSDDTKTLAFYVMEILTIYLTDADSSSISSFKDCGGIKAVELLLNFDLSRPPALTVMKQLLVSPTPTGVLENLFVPLTAPLSTATSPHTRLKIDTLRVFNEALNESHHTRVAFRKKNGFSMTVQILAQLQGSLSETPPSIWAGTKPYEILEIIRLTLSALCASMKNELTNRKDLEKKRNVQKFVAVLRDLGCFSGNEWFLTGCLDRVAGTEVRPELVQELRDAFYMPFCEQALKEVTKTLDGQLLYPCIIFRFLVNMVLDKFTLRAGFKIRNSRFGETFSPSTEACLHNPACVNVIIRLFPAVSNCDSKRGLHLLTHLGSVLLKLSKSPQSQQRLCQAGAIGELLAHCSMAIYGDRHPLYNSLQHVFERLASQMLSPYELRSYLRLGDPLRTQVPCESPTSVVPMATVTCLVSIATTQGTDTNRERICPSFVEMDMRREGWACLFMPSFCPKTSSLTPTGGDMALLGGLGRGERAFPPPSGLSFTTWFSVQCLPGGGAADEHPVRLLQVVRKVIGKEAGSSMVCLYVALRTRDKSLVISTRESLLVEDPLAGLTSSDGVVCLNMASLFETGVWHNLTIVLQKSGLLRYSSASVYIDGSLHSTERLRYISANIHQSGSTYHQHSVFAYVGSPPCQTVVAPLIWQQGPLWLTEEVLPAAVVTKMHSMGPSYIGNYQSVGAESEDLETMSSGASLLNEERIVFSLHPYYHTTATLDNLKKRVPSRDCKSVCKQLGLAYEGETTLIVLPNTSSHLMGSARSAGAFLSCHSGSRVFTPRPLSYSFNLIGGVPVLLGFVAMASDIDGLYASLKVLVAIVKSSVKMQHQMDQVRGYQILSMLFKKKQKLLNSHILHLTLVLVGTVESTQEVSAITNRTAFEDLLCDVDTWHRAPGTLFLVLYDHFTELLTSTRDNTVNSRVMNEAGLLDKLLYVLGAFDHEAHIYEPISNLVFQLVKTHHDHRGLTSLGRFLLTTLPKFYEGSLIDGSMSSSPSSENVGQGSPKISLRNFMLDKLFDLLTNMRTGFNVTFSEKVLKTLSFDFFFCFLRGGLHEGTVVLSLRLLFLLIDSPENRKKFSEGSHMGGWLRNPDTSCGSQEGVLQEYGKEQELGEGVNLGACEVPGFLRLQWLLQDQADIVPVYFMLAALTCGHKAFYPIPASKKLNLDNLCEYVIGRKEDKGKSSNSKWCIEPAVIILCMVRKKLMDGDDIHRCRHAVNILQFLQFLYTTEPAFKSLSHSPSYLATLASLLSLPNDSTISRNPVEEGLTTAYRPDQIVKDYLKQLVMDVFAGSFKKSTNVVDLLLDKVCDYVEERSVGALQVYVLGLTMSHFRDVSILNAESTSLHGYKSSEQANIISNAVAFTCKVADHLWNGLEVKGVYIFMKEMVYQAKRRASGISMDTIYRSLNRTILFEIHHISRMHDKMETEGLVAVLLNRLLDDKTLVFSPANFDVEFLGCITHFLIVWSRNGCIVESTNTTWHVVPFPEDSNASATTLLCQKVWNELYILKKNAIEEVLHQSFTETDPPDLAEISVEACQAVDKIWSLYVDKEMKNKGQDKENLNYLTHKIQKVGSGVLKVAMGRQAKIESPMFCGCEFTKVEISGWTAKHVALVAERFESLHHTFLLDQKHMVSILMEEWSEIEKDLLRERGVWGPQADWPLEKWMLDTTEGRNRMRRRMKRNELFYFHYPYQTNTTKSARHRPPMSRHSEAYFSQHTPVHLIADPDQDKGAVASARNERDSPVFFDDTETETPSEDGHVPSLVDLPGKRRTSRAGSEVDTSVEPSESGDQDRSSPATELDDMGGPLNDDLESLLATNQTLARLIGNKEQIVEVHRCAKIQGLESTEGLLLFGKQKYYIITGFTLQRGKEITTMDGIADDEWQPIVPKSTYSSRAPSSPLKASTSSVSDSIGPAQECFVFLYEDLREVLKMWYLLQPIALEVFSADGRNSLLAFEKGERKKIQTKLISLAPYLTTSQASKAGQSQSTRIEQGIGLISNIMGDKSVTTRWERGEISNFQYLMYLNTLAGRSYNDLMQYPVFPWVLADYESEELNLKDPASFRDFSKPMGAQTPARLKQFQKRFQEWDDPTGETSAYHYGTHYSSAMIVGSYLIRLEPFTQFFLKLQGGHFDLADRLFHSIKDAWVSSSYSNMADVKELIPEFFYLPEFLTNSNNFDLGTKQSGVQLGDVVLPPWSKGDPAEFIRQHRRALECDYVSAHLHEWIDLIFGYKQLGLHAEEASNVFHPLFYEGSVDIYSIEDPVRRNAIIGFINNFGQVPKQLFKKPHNQKKVMTEGGDLSSMLQMNQLLFYQSPENLKPDLTPIKELKKAVGQILCTDHSLYVIEKGKLLVPGTSASMRYIRWNLPDLSIQICDYESGRILSMFDSVIMERVECSILMNDRTVATAGASLAVQIWSLQIDKGQPRMVLKRSLFGHTNTVVCLATSPSYQLLASGSEDGTCILWDTLRLAYVRQLPQHNGTVSAISINDLSGNIATCSGSKLTLWSINGDQLGQVDTAVHADMRSINCVAMTEMREWDSENLVLTGGSDGVVRMWGLEFVKSKKEELEWRKTEGSQSESPAYHLWNRQLLLKSKLTLHTAFERKDNQEPSPITALAISRDHKTVYVGDEKGRLYSWSLSTDPGSVANDQWVMDSSSHACEGCQAPFTFTNRRHHCRDCGKLFCYKCSKHVSEIPALKTVRPVRVCFKCYKSLQKKSKH